jgi:hypothetical protein
MFSMCIQMVFACVTLRCLGKELKEGSMRELELICDTFEQAARLGGRVAQIQVRSLVTSSKNQLKYSSSQ